jgi:hypothetical protein
VKGQLLHGISSGIVDQSIGLFHDIVGFPKILIDNQFPFQEILSQDDHFLEGDVLMQLFMQVLKFQMEEVFCIKKPVIYQNGRNLKNTGKPDGFKLNSENFIPAMKDEKTFHVGLNANYTGKEGLYIVTIKT